MCIKELSMEKEITKYVRIQNISGHTCFVTIPAAVVKELDLKQGDDVWFHYDPGKRQLIYDVLKGGKPA